MAIDFSFTEEQSMLQDMIHNFMEKECTPEVIRVAKTYGL